jgi:hypothetical protein
MKYIWRPNNDAYFSFLNKTPMKTQIKIKRALTIVAFILAFSACKKDGKENGPQTIEEFEKIMADDPNIQVFLKTSHEIFLEKAKSVKYNMGRQRPSEEEVSARMNAVKDKAEIVEVFKSYNIYNAEIAVELLYKQSNAMLAFKLQYPTFVTVPENERKALLIKLLNENAEQARKLTASLSYSGSGNYNKVMNMRGPGDVCATNYNESFNNCETGYNVALAGIWAGVAIASGQTAGLSILGGFLGTLIAYIAWDQCVVDAGTAFMRCLGSTEN